MRCRKKVNSVISNMLMEHASNHNTTVWVLEDIDSVTINIFILYIYILINFFKFYISSTICHCQFKLMAQFNRGQMVRMNLRSDTCCGTCHDLGLPQVVR